MNEIILRGTQQFLGKEIPVVYGGFGENQKCISDKTIAEIHGMETKHVRERILINIRRFKENVDFIDLKIVVGANDDKSEQHACLTDTLELKKDVGESHNNLLKDIGVNDTSAIDEGACLVSTLEKEQRVDESHTLDLLLNMGYSKMQISKAEHIYLLSERGYAKLIKIMDSDLAWEIHDRLMDEYFSLREERGNLIYAGIEIKDEISKLNEQMIELSDQMQSLSNYVTINSHQSQKLLELAKNRVNTLLGGARSEKYKQYSRMYFKNLWLGLGHELKVSSYKDLNPVHMSDAINFIRTWDYVGD